MSRILVTGAAGRLGTMLRERLPRPGRVLRLLDRLPVPDPRPSEEIVTADLADAAAVAGACRDVDAIVHLGGQPREAGWDVILAANVAGSVNLYEGARAAGVGRVLYASSNHVIGLWRTGDRLDHTAAPRPDSRYGVSKAFGESLAQLYAYKYGIAGFVMRIGGCRPAPGDRRGLSTWLSPDDFARLVEVGLAAEYVCEIVYGVSANAAAWWDNGNAARLGYRPQDRAEDRPPDTDADRGADPGGIAAAFQGGTMAAAEFAADPARIPPAPGGRG